MKQISIIFFLLTAIFASPSLAQVDTVYVVNPEALRAPQAGNPYSTPRKVGLGGFAISWLGTAIVSGAIGDEFMETTIVPLIGPFLTMQRIDSDPDAEYLPGGEGLLVVSAIAQNVFAAVMIVNAVREHRYNEAHRVSMEAIPGRTISLVLRF